MYLAAKPFDRSTPQAGTAVGIGTVEERAGGIKPRQLSAHAFTKATFFILGEMDGWVDGWMDGWTAPFFPSTYLT